MPPIQINEDSDSRRIMRFYINAVTFAPASNVLDVIRKASAATCLDEFDYHHVLKFASLRFK